MRAKGVIIDLRMNNGGNSDRGAAILSHFTTDTLYGSKWKTRIHVAAYKAWSKYFEEYKLYGEGDAWQEESDWKYEPTSGRKISAPVVVLISRKTRSAAEDFLIFADPLSHFTFIGEPSAGSTGQPLIVNLPGGGFAGIVSKRDQYPDGRDFVGYGVQPDYFVERTLEDLLGYSDPTLDKGIDILQRLIK
jgi:C-terminal processing protease CtpA/Prc